MTKILLFTIVFLLFLDSMFAKRLKILVNSPNGWFSHAQFQGKLADVLVDAGHEVHFFIPEWNIESQHNFSQKSHKIIRFSIQSPTQYKEMAFHTNPFDPNQVFDSTFVDKMRNISAQFGIEMSKNDSWIIKQFIAENYDVGISELIDTYIFGIFEKVGIRTKLISSALGLGEGVGEIFGIPMPKSYVPMLFASPLSMNYVDRVHNLYYSYKQTIQQLLTLPSLDTILKTSFGQNFPDLLDIVSKTSFVFINMPEFLDIPRPLSSKLVHIGGIAMSKPKPLDSDITKIYEKSKNGVVIFSFGSIASTDLLPEHVRMAYLEAFSNFPEYEFIWKYHLRENDPSLFAKYPNVHPVEWLEQNSLLAHPKTKAFMTHGGLNSLTEGSFNGVPLIVAPLFADQNYNTFIAKQKETGVYINLKEISAKLIQDALEEVLYSDKYYQNAQKLKKRLQSYPYKAHEKFVKYVEYAAENSFNDDLNLAGAKLSFIEYYCLDIIIPFVILPFFLFSITFVFLIYRSVRFFSFLFYPVKINKIE